MKNTCNRRRGVSLLELLVVVTMIGIFASVATARFGRSVFGNFGAQADARQVSLALLQAQRMAIMTGDNHVVEFTGNGARVRGFRILRRTATGLEQADTPRPFSRDVRVRSSHSQAEFTFEGQALAPYQLELRGDDRVFRVDVVPLNGTVRVQQI